MFGELMREFFPAKQDRQCLEAAGCEQLKFMILVLALISVSLFEEDGLDSLVCF
jgi:hypothetical protein